MTPTTIATPAPGTAIATADRSAHTMFGGTAAAFLSLFTVIAMTSTTAMQMMAG